MTDRTVKTTLILQATGYIQGMEKAAGKTRDLGSEAEKLAQKRQSFEILGRTLLAVGIAAAVGVGMAVAKFAEFDQAMSQVNAVTQESVEGQNALRDAALEAGGATVFTAREAAEAEEELAKAGLKTAYILGGALSGSLALAAAGQLEVARSAEIMGITLKQFSLDGSQAARVADVLAAGANKAVGGVEELAQGLKFVGPVADSMNVSLEDTVATLALFADRGILGEQAGTSLRGVLASLTSPSKAANDELKRLNITLYDTETKRFLGLQNATGELNRALDGVSDSERDMSLGLIFGNQQVTAARVLVSAGADTWQEYRDAVEDTGIAQRIAAERMNNLAGDVEKLGGAVDTALIRTGSGANDTLRSLVQSVAFLVDMLGEAPQPVLNVGLAIGVVAAVMALTGGAALLAVPKIADFRAALATTQIGAKGASVAIAGVGLALGVTTLLVGYFVGRAAEASASADEFAASLDKASGAATDYTRELVAKRLAESGAYDSAKNLGISQKELTDAVLEGGDALDEINAKLTAQNNIVDFFNGSGIAAGNAQATIRDLTNELKTGKERFENLEEATADSTVTLDQFSGKVTVANIDLKELKSTIEGFGSAQLDVNSATRSFEAAIDDATKAVQENGQTLDLTTEAGRANSAALDSIAESAIALAAAQVDTIDGQVKATKAIEDGRQAYIDASVAAGVSRDEAERYADALGLIPSNIPVTFQVNSSGLSTAEAGLRRIADLLGKNYSMSASLRPKGFASGGYTGDGSPTDAAGIVHKREWVSTPETVSKPANLAALQWMHAGGDMANYQSAPPQYASTSGSSGPVTALIDPSFIKAVRELAEARRTDLSTVGLANAAGAGSALNHAAGAA